MRYALIIAGGSGTRLWPMSTASLPKQLIPFIDGRSLLQLTLDRLEGLLPAEHIFICAGTAHRDVMLNNLSAMTADRFIGEPMGRDTLNAVGLGVAVLARHDPSAVVAVFTADHIIEPVDRFRQIVDQGFALAEQSPDTLVTFGITPTHAATGYGYLQLGEPMGDTDARQVDHYKEKPDLATAQAYLDAGPEKYLWNSGMFVWRAATLLDCIRRYEPANHAGLMRIAHGWDTDRRQAVLAEVYPNLKKISVDYAVMEPASKDPHVIVAAIPMPLSWLDVGSWPSFALTRPKDDQGNAVAGCRSMLLETKNALLVSDDPNHLIAAIGCDDLIVVHTARATLVCRADQAEKIKAMHAMVGEKFGEELL
jgi:mannose-1-phosphate guanylyltransferase